MFEVQERVEATWDPEIGEVCGTIQYVDTRTMIIACTKGDSALISPGQDIVLQQAIAGNLYVMNTQVMTRKDSGFAVKIASLKIIQRRKAKRIPCGLAAWHWPQPNPAAVAPNPQESPGWVKDISIGGVKLCVESIIMQGTKLMMQVQLDAKSNIIVGASVIRCDLETEPYQSASGPLAYALALQFVELSRIDQLQLQKFVQSLNG